MCEGVGRGGAMAVDEGSAMDEATWVDAVGLHALRLSAIGTDKDQKA